MKWLCNVFQDGLGLHNGLAGGTSSAGLGATQRIAGGNAGCSINARGRLTEFPHLGPIQNRAREVGPGNVNLLKGAAKENSIGQNGIPSGLCGQTLQNRASPS